MFISGANQQDAELRLPSIKGVLRFWWRTLVKKSFRDDIKLMHKEEAIIFGSTEAQAKVLMRLDVGKLNSVDVGEVLKANNKVVGDGARYLGYGVMEAFASRNKGTEAGQLTRPCLEAPFEFSLSFVYHKSSINEEQSQAIQNALKVMGLLGGLGSKARKGYGSINLLSLKTNEKTIWTHPKNLSEYKQELASLIALTSSYADLPDFTAFSRRTRIALLEGDGNEIPLQLLNKIGRDFVFFRSWGRNGRVLNESSEKNFKDDHDLMKNISKRIPYPQRVVFGLPHNYGQRPYQHVTGKDHDRRSSPLLFHIHQPQSSLPPIAVISFLPAKFLPSKDKISVGGKTQNFDDSKNDFWQPAHDFLDRMLDKNRQGLKPRRSNFSRVEEISYG